MKKTSVYAIITMVICSFFTASGTIFLKLGMSIFTGFNVNLFYNWALIFGCLLYGIGALLLMVSLKQGELSVIYPIISLSFVWVNIFGFFFLKESLTLFKWSGVFIIIIGISLIGVGSR